MATHAHSDIEMEPLVADSSSSPNNTSKSSQTIVSTLLGYRQIAANAAMRNRNAIYAAQVAVFICYLCVVFLSHGMDASDSKEHGCEFNYTTDGLVGHWAEVGCLNSDSTQAYRQEWYQVRPPTAAD